MSRVVHVRTPVRLHFGLFSFGHADRPQFGGVGMMVEPPNVQITIRPAAQFTTCGPLADRVAEFATACCRNWDIKNGLHCRIDIESAPDPHVGLGVGTQLGLAVATGLAQFLGRGPLTPVELASATGRGLRSAVGTYGFLQGGMIVDAGKAGFQSLGRLESRHDVPPEWRIVLIRAESAIGFSGQHEVDAFARLPPVPLAVTNELWQHTRQELLPSLDRSDAAAFGEAVYRFGVLAGGAFAAVQGGPFGTPWVADLVTAIRRYGVPGVGQSSWGPTLFAVTGSQAEADALVSWLQSGGEFDAQRITIARPNNHGALVDDCEEPDEAADSDPVAV